MAADIDRAGVAKAYERWAPVYDLVFGKVFDHGRQSTIAEADKIGGRILDVGVGTGLSLSDYSPTTKLCGVDISEPMLRKAQSRVRALGLGNVETLAVMDARNLAFADSSFDAVVAQYVITAVPDPEATLDDFIRVLKPGGELILVNHIGAERGPRRIFELAFAPLARRLGWGAGVFPDAAKTLTVFCVSTDRGVRGGERAGPTRAGDAAGSNRAARAGSRGQ